MGGRGRACPKGQHQKLTSALLSAFLRRPSRNSADFTGHRPCPFECTAFTCRYSTARDRNQKQRGHEEETLSRTTLAPRHKGCTASACEVLGGQRLHALLPPCEHDR